MATSHLSVAQVRRAFLPSKLSEVGWELDDAAKLLEIIGQDLIRRREGEGVDFGYTLRPDVLAAAQAS